MLLLIFWSLSFATDIPKKDFVDLSTLESVKIDLRYATKNNFVGENMYGDFKTAYLHNAATEKFKKAIQNLSSQKPNYKFIIFDALRPRSVQKILWNKVKGTQNERYVMNPEKGSVHNYGFALDLSIVDENDKELDMGTSFDNFTALAEPQLEEKLLKEGKLTNQQIQNREILRKSMLGAGFKQLPHEWWHFDGATRETLKANYRIVE